MAKKSRIQIEEFEYRKGMIIRGCTSNKKMDEVVTSICSQHKGIKCFGYLVDVRDRHCAYFIEYKGKIYESMEWHGTTINGKMHVAIVFELYDGNISDTESRENYKYVVDYFKPGVSEEPGEVWYYKEEELPIAEKRQEELDPRYAFIEEVRPR